VPLYVSARGLTTGSMPYGDRLFQLDLDFVDHRPARGKLISGRILCVRPAPMSV
jgi:hypothetical protein